MKNRMRKRMKRVAIIALALVMSASVLTGCTSGKKTPPVRNSTSQSQTKQESKKAPKTDKNGQDTPAKKENDNKPAAGSQTPSRSQTGQDDKKNSETSKQDRDTSTKKEDAGKQESGSQPQSGQDDKKNPSTGKQDQDTSVKKEDAGKQESGSRTSGASQNQSAGKK